MDTAAMVTKKRPSSGGHRGVYKKEVFFTGTVVLVVKKNGEFVFITYDWVICWAEMNGDPFCQSTCACNCYIISGSIYERIWTFISSQ